MNYKTKITCVSSLQLQEPVKLVKRNANVFVILKNNRKPSKTQFFTVEKQIFGAYEIVLFSPKMSDTVIPYEFVDARSY